MTLLTCPACGDLSGPLEGLCEGCGEPLTLVSASARRRELLASGRRALVSSRPDLIGPERSEGPSVAPRTLDQWSEKCVHRGNTPAQSDISTIRRALPATGLGSDDPQVRGVGCGTLGLASDGKPVALDPFGSRARLRDALHGDDGSPGNGRVGAIVELGTARAPSGDRCRRHDGACDCDAPLVYHLAELVWALWCAGDRALWRALLCRAIALQGARA